MTLGGSKSSSYSPIRAAAVSLTEEIPSANGSWCPQMNKTFTQSPMKYKEHAWVLTLTRYTLWTPTYEALLLSSFQIMSSRPWNITCEQLNHSQTNHTESANVLDLVLEENKHFLNKQSIFSCLIHWLFYIICLLHLLLFLHVIWWCYISVQKATRLQGYKKTTHIYFF